MNLGWLSDVHLDHASEARVLEFLARLETQSSVDAWLLGGDIGQANSVISLLRRVEASSRAPIYFVLGNHDFYGGGISKVRSKVSVVARESARLVYLTGSSPVPLGEDVVLLGDDGWADARLGDALHSEVQLNDFFLIAELTGLPVTRRIATLQRLGDESAARLRGKLDAAARVVSGARAPTFVVLLHVPPFREAAWHEGRPSAPDWLPWFSCKAVGDVLLEAATASASSHFLVFCGHTHGSGAYRPLPNLTIYTAGARYGMPEVQRVFNPVFLAREEFGDFSSSPPSPGSPILPS